MSDRYDTKGNPEGEFQPCSNDQVLVNKLGISDVKEIEIAEFDVLVEFQTSLFDEIEMDSDIAAKDLCDWHSRWLGNIYDWSGSYRTVNMEKDGFIFAAAHLLPNLMTEFERDYLAVYTPSNNLDRNELVNAMALCHVEFIIIHPFRDGNGRLGRLLATVMALQANMPVLDFRFIEENKADYIAAIHAGHTKNYESMKLIFSEVLERSLTESGPI